MAWALSRKGIGPTEKLVLIILADRSDKNGWSFYGQQTIADKANVTRKTVRTALQSLEESGLIERVPWNIGNLRTSDKIRILAG